MCLSSMCSIALQSLAQMLDSHKELLFLDTRPSWSSLCRLGSLESTLSQTWSLCWDSAQLSDVQIQALRARKHCRVQIMKQRLQCTAICLDNHLISNFGQGRNGIWDPNCLCKHTTFTCMDSTYCFGRVHVDVMSALVTVLQSLDVIENTLLDRTN